MGAQASGAEAAVEGETAVSVSETFAEIRNPETRRKGLRTLVLAVGIATGSVSGGIMGTQAATGLYAVGMERAQIPMIFAEIESLRTDVSRLDCGSAAMVVGQVADWNRRIEHEKESNRHWFSDWASSDRWMGVSRITIPCRGEE